MTWRIDGLVAHGGAPHATSGSNDPEVATALEALKAMTSGSADQAMRSPLPNPITPNQPAPASAQQTSTANDAEIGD
jgi:hypothetical protein